MTKRIFALLLALTLLFGTVAIAEESENKGLFQHTHLWSLIPVSDTATCTKPGVKTYRCTNIIGTGLKGCEETKVVDSPAKGHTNITIASTKATCTSPATETKYCLTCGYTDVRKTGEALGHSWGDWAVEGEVVCGQEYRMTRTCKTCGQKDWQTKKQTGHVWGEWKTVKAAKCEAEGLRTRKCASCGKEEEQTIAKLGHNFLLSGLDTVQPTCVAEGKNVNICSRCLKRVETTLPALGHDWTGLSEIVPTCTEPGFLGKRCNRCGLQEYGTEIGKPLGHDYQLTMDTSTCTLPGVQTFTCSHAVLGLCNEPTIVKVVPAKGHSVSEWTTVTKPGCLTTGKATGVCETCGKTVTNILPALGHDWTGEKYIVKPTCTEPGLVTDAVCSRCGTEAIGTGTRVVPATGHDYKENVVKPATCGEDGILEIVCQNCHDTKTEVIPATGEHDYHLKMVSFLKFRFVCSECGNIYQW